MNDKAPRVLVCGGRNYSDRRKVFNTLDEICKKRGWITEPDRYGNWLPRIHIIHGGSSGADEFADEYAVVSWCELTVFGAYWEMHGNAAGPIRNQRMLDEGNPDLVVAFPGGRGTADMIARAERAGVEIIHVK